MYRNKKTGIIGVIVTVIILITIVVVSNIEIENFSQIGGCLLYTSPSPRDCS